MAIWESLSGGAAGKRGVPFQLNGDLPGISRRVKNRLPFAEIGSRNRELEGCTGRKRAGSVNLRGARGGRKLRQFQIRRVRAGMHPEHAP